MTNIVEIPKRNTGEYIWCQGCMVPLGAGNCYSCNSEKEKYVEKTEDFKDLTKQPLDKLTKLLDVAKDYRLDCFKDYTEADDRVKDIQLEISKRLEENNK